MKAGADRKQRAKRRNAERAAAKPALRLVPKTPPPKLPERTGLQWLLHKKHITDEECRAGIRFGKDYRSAEINGMEPIKSCIASDAGGGSVASSRSHESHAEFSADTNQRLALALDALKHDDEMRDALIAVCARQLTPRQINPNQRASERITHVLRCGLRLLGCHYREAR